MNKSIFFLILFLIITLTIRSFGQLREHPDISLKGLKGIRVVVNYQGPIEASYGLTPKQLQEAIESRFRVNDIKILTEKEWKREPGKPYLSLIIVGTQLGSGKKPTFFYSFATDLIQQVSLGRQPSIKTLGSTWNQDYNFVVPQDSLREVTLKIDEVAQ